MTPSGIHHVSPWQGSPFLVHGFGNRYLCETDLRNLFAEEMFRCHFLRQIHGEIIHVVDETSEGPLPGDALITNHHGVLLVVKTADCLPVLLWDERNMVIAAVHCGWRGTHLRILKGVVERMLDRFGCSPSSMSAAMGPAICAGCYPVGREVRETFLSAGHPLEIFQEDPCDLENWRLDLRKANRHQLMSAGLEDDRIFSVDRCTYCETDLHSFRRDGDSAGRMLNFIGLSRFEDGDRRR